MYDSIYGDSSLRPPIEITVEPLPVTIRRYTMAFAPAGYPLVRTGTLPPLVVGSAAELAEATCGDDRHTQYRATRGAIAALGGYPTAWRTLALSWTHGEIRRSLHEVGGSV
jgi:hypothetical protein